MVGIAVSYQWQLDLQAPLYILLLLSNLVSFSPFFDGSSFHHLFTGRCTCTQPSGQGCRR